MDKDYYLCLMTFRFKNPINLTPPCLILPRLCLEPCTLSLITMVVDDALIDKLAHLARLRFQPEEKERLKQDLQKMIAFVEQLQALDTEGELPVLQMSTNTDVLREDVIQKTLSREEALKNAPVTDGVFFIVPKVISK